MNRRDAIKRTSLLLGYAVSASSVAAVMSGCKADPKVLAGGLDNWTPEMMTKDQGQLVAQLAETILPKTDSAGAIEAGVHSYIDMVLKNLASTEEKEGFKGWIADFQQRAQSSIGKSFVDASASEKEKFLTEYETAAKNSSDMPLAAYWQVKEQILLGYFTSEKGMKEALLFLPIPGEYKACIPYEEVGGMWAI